MIEVERLTKRYGSRTAVRDVSFHVRKGEIVGFLGPNGAGKSTTIRMITGFLAPTGGSVKVGGIDALRDPMGARRLIGYMPEGVPLYLEMRVSEYLRYRAELKGIPGRQIASSVERALSQAAVTDAADRIIGQLSKGYRQRVGLADALVADPPLLILDEPSSGLDPNQIRQVRRLIKGFAGEKTVFLSTHILPEVEATCERVVIINKGTKVGEGQPAELRQRARAGRGLVLVGRGSEADLRSAVEGCPAVEEVQDVARVGEGAFQLTLRTSDRDDAAEAVFHAIAAAGLALRELRGTGGSLEDVFTDLTTHEPEPELAGDVRASDAPADEDEQDHEDDEGGAS